MGSRCIILSLRSETQQNKRPHVVQGHGVSRKERIPRQTFGGKHGGCPPAPRSIIPEINLTWRNRRLPTQQSAVQQRTQAQEKGGMCVATALGHRKRHVEGWR